MQISNIHPNGRQISNGLRPFIFIFAYVNILEMKTKLSKQSSKPKQILSHFNIFPQKQNKWQPIQCDHNKCGEIVKCDVNDDSKIRMN